MRVAILFAALALEACCTCPGAGAPPPIYTPPEETEGAGDESAQTPEPAPAQRGFDESAALNVAMGVADSEGYDPALYTDVVVEDGGDHWIVQMRRPRVLRFIEVHVNKDDGSALFDTRTAQ